MAPGTLRLGISSCLLGQKVRYDGDHKRDPFLVEVFGEIVEWVAVCPEVEMGMGVPREPIRLVGPMNRSRLLAEHSGKDHTDAMRRFSEVRVEELERLELCGYVAKKDSPSCGMERVKVWDDEGRGPPRREGVGAYLHVLRDRLPLLPMEDEGRLRDRARCENFVERIFGYTRFRDAVAEGITPFGLVSFHTRHKLAVLAHSPAAYKRLGRLVASSERKIDGKAREYGEVFMAALNVPSTRGKHANVLRHMAGYCRRVISRADHEELSEVISRYDRGQVPLVVPLMLIGHHARVSGVSYLCEQTYLYPDPRELKLRSRL